MVLLVYRVDLRKINSNNNTMSLEFHGWFEMLPLSVISEVLCVFDKELWLALSIGIEIHSYGY